MGKTFTNGQTHTYDSNKYIHYDFSGRHEEFWSAYTSAIGSHDRLMLQNSWRNYPWTTYYTFTHDFYNADVYLFQEWSPDKKLDMERYDIFWYTLTPSLSYTLTFGTTYNTVSAGVSTKNQDASSLPFSKNIADGLFGYVTFTNGVTITWSRNNSVNWGTQTVTPYM